MEWGKIWNKNMKYRDYIIGPEDLLGVPKGYVLAVPEGSNGAVAIPFQGRDELYEETLNNLLTWGTPTGGIQWNGLNLRASTGIPLDLIKAGERPIIYYREPTRTLKEPEELGYPKDFLDKFKKIKTGLVLFCGAQGAGKTTGMMSILRQRIRLNGERAVTFEAPAEYNISGQHDQGFIDQISVPNEKYFSQCAGISLRMASPDIVCYGEIRGFSGVSELCSNAFSSHVVMTTLHSTNIMSGISRFVTFLTAGEVEHRDYYMKVLSECLKLCVHQKLEWDGKKIRLGIKYLEYTEELRSAIYSGASSARISDVLDRQNVMRANNEL